MKSKYRIKRTAILSVSLFILSVCAVFAQDWKDVYHFNPSQTLNKLKFLNDQTGFTAGSLYNGSKENIHITHDGGKTWSNVSSGYTSMRFMDIFILDSSTIFMSGNDGIIIRSTDGGGSWQTMHTGITEQLWGIYFLNQNLGFAVGSNGTIIRSTNGGLDWESVPTGISNLFYDVFFTKQGIGFASGSNVLYKTIDNGDNWFPVTDFPFEAPADWIRSIKMVNENTGYACADIGRIYKTTDGGDHWIRLQSGTQEALFDVSFVDELNGMICGFNGTILSTNDGGQSWKQLANPISNEIFYSIDLITKDLGYICTHTGHILKLNLKTGLKDEIYADHKDLLYPNPCQNNVHLTLGSLSKNQVQRIVLSDVTGKSYDLNWNWEDNNHLMLNLQNTGNGLFIIRVVSEKQILRFPLSIQSN